MNKLNIAIETGKILYKEKLKNGHGSWERYIIDNYPFSIRTGRNYINLHIYKSAIDSAKITEIKKAYEYIKGITETVAETDLFEGIEFYNNRFDPILKKICNLINKNRKLVNPAIEKFKSLKNSI